MNKNNKKIVENTEELIIDEYLFTKELNKLKDRFNINIENIEEVSIPVIVLFYRKNNKDIDYKYKGSIRILEISYYLKSKNMKLHYISLNNKKVYDHFYKLIFNNDYKDIMTIKVILDDNKNVFSLKFINHYKEEVFGNYSIYYDDNDIILFNDRSNIDTREDIFRYFSKIIKSNEKKLSKKESSILFTKFLFSSFGILFLFTEIIDKVIINRKKYSIVDKIKNLLKK